jgi:hypothetical protein
VAMFDWDNTVVKNDIGDATFFWMVKNDKIRQPPEGDWRLTSPYLTQAAADALSAACGAAAAPGHPLDSSTDTACADELVSVYVDAATTTGQKAFNGWNYRRMEPSYAWAAQLQAGWTPQQMHGFTQATMGENFAAPIGATQVVGTRIVNGYIRIYDQIRDLIVTMQDNGFDVWIISASPQVVVEAIAPHVNVAPDHVVGIRMVTDDRGRLTHHIQGCGDVADGDDSMISYIDGKRCWINKIVYGDDTAGAVDRSPDPGRRQAFAAGDSDTDVTFLQDATGLKLVLNRNKKEVMCNAYWNLHDRWLVNPMFIAPRAQQASSYKCSTNACKDAGGASVPCHDEEGTLIPDQADTVY